MSDRSGTSDVCIRPAQQGDLPELVRIYNHFVTTTHVTFDIEPFDVEQRRSWYMGFDDSGPHRLFVAESGGLPIGYASSREFRAKPAYHSSVETTIYLDPDASGRGIGKKLYGALLDTLIEDETVHRAYGGIALPNDRSIALHEYFGFELIGTFREVGLKFRRYWDVSWYQKDVAARKGN